MADALRPPRHPGVFGSRRLRRPRHAPASPCCGAPPPPAAAAPVVAPTPAPVVAPVTSPTPRSGDPAGCRSLTEPVRRRGGPVRRQLPRLRRRDASADGERRSIDGRGGSAEPAGSTPAGRPVQARGSASVPRSVAATRARRPRRTRRARSARADVLLLSRPGGRPRRRAERPASRGCRAVGSDRRAVRASEPSAPGRPSLPADGAPVARRAAGWRPRQRRRRADGTRAANRAGEPRASVSGGSVARLGALRAAARGERRLARRCPPSARVDRCGPRPPGRIDRGRNVAAGAPP